jgi:hypothetical protein
VVEGFAFAPARVTGLKDLADNTQKDLVVESPEPTYNFEADIEFYHPGGSAPPQRYTFKVAGSATIAGPAGPVDCWVVTTDYNQPGRLSTFWFAKATQLMLRQQGALPDGKVLVKTLID